MANLAFSNANLRSVFKALKAAESLEDLLDKNPCVRVDQQEEWKQLAFNMWELNKKMLLQHGKVPVPAMAHA